MLPNKYTPIKKSKLYKAISFYRKFEGLLIPKDDISDYSEIEYLVILYALGYVRDGDAGYFLKIR